MHSYSWLSLFVLVSSAQVDVVGAQPIERFAKPTTMLVYSSDADVTYSSGKKHRLLYGDVVTAIGKTKGQVVLNDRGLIVASAVTSVEGFAAKCESEVNQDETATNLTHRAIVRIIEKKFDQARSDLDDALKLDDRHARAYAVYARLDSNQNELGEALANIGYAIWLDSSVYQYHFDQGLYHIATKKIAAARRDFAECIRISPGAFKARVWAALTVKDNVDKSLAHFDQAVAIEPKCSDIYFQRGKMLAFSGRVSDALRDFDLAVSIQPDNAAYLYERGLAYTRLGRMDDALKGISDAIRRDPGNAVAYFNRGVLYAKTKAFDKALEDLNESTRLDPDFLEPHFAASTIHFERDDYEKAKISLQRALKLDPKSVKVLKAIASAHHYLGEYKSATEYADRLIAITAKDHEAFSLRADCDFKVGDYTKAVEDLDNAIQILALPEYFSRRAEAYYRLNRPVYALRDSRQALKLAPKSAEASAGVAAALIELSRHDEARKFIEKVLAIEPNNEFALQLADVLAVKQQQDGELGRLDNAVEKSPNDAAPLVERARFFVAAGKYEEAIEDCQEAIRIGEDDYEALVVRGRAYCFIGKLDLAHQDFRECLKLNPEKTAAYHERSRLWTSQGMPEHAIGDLTRLIELDPQSEIAYEERALLLGQGNDYAAALDDFDQLIELAPNSANYRIGRGVTLVELGKVSDALKSYTRAIELSPEKPGGYEQRGVLFDLLADADRSIRDLTAAANRGSELSDVYYLLGFYAVRDNQAKVAKERLTQALQLRDDPEYRELRAVACLALKEFDRALKDLTECVRTDPTADRYYNCGVAASMAERSKESVEYLSKAIELDPSVKNYTFRGAAYADSGQFQNACEDFTKAIETNPTSRLYSLRAEMWLELKKAELALADFVEAQSLDDSPISSFSAARVYLLQEKYSEALAACDKAADEGVKAAAINRLRGDILSKLGREEEAKQAYAKAGDNPATRRYRIKAEIGAVAIENDPVHDSLVLVGAGRFAEAIKRLNAELEEHRFRKDALEMRAHVYARAGRLEESKQEYSRILVAWPDDTDARRNLASVLAMMGKADDALSEIDIILADEPANVDGLLLRGKLLANQGDFVGAEADFTTVAELKPRDTGVLLLRAVLRLKADQEQKAMEDFDAVLKIDPANQYALHNRGQLRLNRGELKLAVEDFSDAINLNERLLPSYDGRISANLRLRAYAKVREDLMKRLELAKDKMATQNNLAWLLAVCPDASVRDGKTAVRLSEEVCRLTRNTVPQYLHTLSAAYGASNEFAKALEYLEKAQSADANAAEEQMAAMKAAFVAGRPFTTENIMQQSRNE